MRHDKLMAWAALVLATLASAATWAAPAWWSAVLDPSGVTNDFAAVNAGQVKWFAVQAHAHLDASLPGGAGGTLDSLLTALSATNNHHAVNQGQLKALTGPFYARLIAVGYTNVYPWTGSLEDDADYALANIGQVKRLFDFEISSVDADEDGLPDWWELAHFGHLDYGPEDDADGDGILNIYEYLHGSTPADSASRPAGTHFVALTGAHTPPFDSWATAATNIQDALDVATNAYDFVWVADGVYSNWNIAFPEAPMTLMSTGGMNTCIIDPGGMGRGFSFAAGQTARTVLNGFTIRNGFDKVYGGGIHIESSSPSIQNCLFQNNRAGWGGGISAAIDSEPRIVNSIFVGNTAVPGWGGAIEIWKSSPTIVNCTIVSNTAQLIGGGGIACGSDSGSWQPHIENVLFGENVPDSIGVCYGAEYISPLVRHSLVPGGWAGGEQIIDADPQIVGSRFWLLGTSPCIDTGTAAGPVRDWEGEARWDHLAHTNLVSIRDIGADEFVDTDGDGLPDGFEWELGTDPLLADTDGDGDSDYAEFLAGTDPLDPDSRLIAISGVVTHTGAYGGPIRVLASVDSNVWESAWSTTIAVTGAYTIAKVPNITNYYILAYRDALANGIREPWEPSGSYPGNPLALVLADDQTGIDIVLEDTPESPELVLSVSIHEPEDAAVFVYPHARVVVYCSSLMATVTVNQAATQRDGYLRYVWTGLVPGTNTLTAEATWDGLNIVSNAIAVVFDDSAYDPDADDDEDGVANHSDLFPLDPSESEDADADGVGANRDYNDLDPTVRGRLRITYPLNGQVFR